LKIESELQAELLKVIDAPGWMTFKHSDGLTSGVPDISRTAYGFTSWWELKRLAPEHVYPMKLSGTELQRINMRQLSLSSVQAAWYVVWTQEHTLIVHPSEVSIRGNVILMRDPEKKRVFGPEDHEAVKLFMIDLHTQVLPRRQ